MIPRIREVHLRNYKSIGDAVVRLSDFNVLVGPNGSGKSNFMDALAFMRDCLTQPVGVAAAAHRGIVMPGSGRSVGIRLIVDLESGTADYGFEAFVESDEWSVVSERFTHVAANGAVHAYSVRDGRLLEAIPGIHPALAADRLVLSAASSLIEFRPLYDFLAGIRLYAIEPARLREMSEPSTGSALLEDGGNAAKVLSRLQHQNLETQARINRVLATVVPDLAYVGAVSLAGRWGLYVSEKHPGGPEPFSSVSMSDGTLRMLGLLLAVYQPSTPTVLLIEEPEATIHPAAADVVMAVLMDAAHRSQVMISTHSPDVLDYKDLADESILIVSKKDGATRIDPLGAASRGVIQRHLSTPGELLRINELNADAAEPELAKARDFFAPVSGTVGEAA
ncbi:MAG TPA: AAA family ATPase [Longimicrobium sp.]|uniref:AAA family ATPase n=1 Tax=Longimicrobium sp. TaxID=2029185 RepID=UPI002ED7A690